MTRSKYLHKRFANELKTCADAGNCLWIIFQLLFLCLIKDNWLGFSTRNAHMVHILEIKKRDFY